MSGLLEINVNEHTKKKGGLTYLSWAWAWAEVLKIDPQAQWVADGFPQADGTTSPCIWVGDTALVSTKVTINGITRCCLLPVMDNRNNAVKNPDARKISDAIMRCMTKAIAMHGLGLYIYAGEDLPEGDDPPDPVNPYPTKKRSGVMADVLGDTPPLPKDQAEYIAEMAQSVTEIFASKGASVAYERVLIEGLDSDQMLHLWGHLDSKVRSGLKVEKGLRVGAA